MDTKKAKPTQVGTGTHALPCAMTIFADAMPFGTVGNVRNLCVGADAVCAMLMPGKQIDRATRQFWKAAKRNIVFIPDDAAAKLTGTQGPDAFCEATVRWAFNRADYIVVWGCNLTDETVARAEVQLAKAKKAVVIMTDERGQAEWTQLADMGMRHRAQLDVFMVTGSAMHKSQADLQARLATDPEFRKEWEAFANKMATDPEFKREVYEHAKSVRACRAKEGAK